MMNDSQKVIWKIGLPVVVTLIVATVLLYSIFSDGLRHMLGYWANREEYSHGFFIPIIAVFLLWQKKNILEQMVFSGSWLGVVTVFLGIGAYFLGELSGIYTFIEYGSIVAIVGLVLSFTGLKALRVILIPLIVLFFMIPLPTFIYNNLSAELQLISSQLGVWVIRLFGISVYLEGNVIDLGSYKLQVVEACSGLRYLFPFMTLGFLAAYLYKGAFWKRAVIFLSSIPITVLMNSFRIGVIGVMVEYWGQSMAEGFLHDFEGWVIFMACTSILVLEMWVLSKIGGEHRPLREIFGLDFPEPSPADAVVHLRKIPPSFMASGAVLVIALVLSFSLEQRSETVPQRMAFSEFAMNLGEWRGKSDRLEQIYLDTLKLDDHIIADFVDGENESVNFYVAYYASQSKGESAHSPRSCLPGAGWLIADLSEKEFDGFKVVNAPLKVNRVVIKKGDYTQLVYYWFQGRGRVITNEYMVKWYLFWDALTKNRTDGALVRLTTFIPPGDDLDAADRRLTEFVAQVNGILGSYIPE